MKKHLQYILLLILVSLTIPLNANYHISLLTCDKGDESYSTFGHTAIRVIDNKNNTDLIYNFGMFQFDVPNFLQKFIKGNLKYWLGIKKTNQFLKLYAYENRTVWEQKLKLNQQIAESIVDTLMHNYKSENRYYYYQFLDQNCTTKARDILFKILNKTIDYQPHKTDKTYRNILDQYLIDKPWTRFGIHLVMGANIDKKIDSYQYMALPENLMNEFIKLQIKHPKIIGKKEIVVKAKTPRSQKNMVISPIIIFSLLLIIRILFKNKYIDYTIWLITTILAALLVIISQYSSHIELQNNWNILWASPTYLILIILGFSKWKKVSKIIAGLNILLIATYTVIRIAEIQVIHYEVLPLIALLLLTNIQIVYPKLTFYKRKTIP